MSISIENIGTCQLRPLREDRYKIGHIIHGILARSQVRQVSLNGYFKEHDFHDHFQNDMRGDYACSKEQQVAVKHFFEAAVHLGTHTDDDVSVGIHVRLTNKAMVWSVEQNASIMDTNYFFN